MKLHGNALSKCLIAVLLIAGILLGSLTLPAAGLAQTAELDETQRNAIAMLNYITVLTQEINASKNSRLYMEQAYSSLINNTNPNMVDSRTLSQMTMLLDIMEDYRMVDVKRDRLLYIYQQNQARAIRAAVPNPLGLLSLIQAGSQGGQIKTKEIVMAVVYMAVDSITSYMSANTENDLQYLKDGWNLDDEATNALHVSRKSAFNYMVKMVGDYNLPGDLTLTENSVDEFVKWKNDENVVGRIQFLESNKSTYQAFGGYWLLLAESYYNNGDYEKTLDAVNTYEAMASPIFRKDYELARILPLAISAANETLEDDAYVDVVSHYIGLLVKNTEHSNWALRYFAAKAYIDLYQVTQDETYLQSAYTVALDNVNYLVGEQRSLNAAYQAPVQEAPVPKDATKDKKKQIKDYNKGLKEARKRELPPVFEPLLLNCDMLFALAEDLNIPESDRKKIEGILHPNGEPAFLTRPLDEQFCFSEISEPMSENNIEFEYGGTAIILPAICVTGQPEITVMVQEPGIEEAATFTDWKVDKVERVAKDDVSSFQVVFTSDDARKHDWLPDATITIDVKPKADVDLKPYHFEYTTHGTKNEWYDYLKVWEGHKNNWYDYGKVWENSVVFERIK